jgi:hypothetical protein
MLLIMQGRHIGCRNERRQRMPGGSPKVAMAKNWEIGSQKPWPSNRNFALNQ